MEALDWDDRTFFDESELLFAQSASVPPAGAPTDSKQVASPSHSQLLAGHRSWRYDYGEQLAEPVPGHLIMLKDLTIHSGPASGKITPFRTEIQTSGDDVWLLVTSVFVVNAASPHGRRMELIAVNTASSQPLQVPASQATARRSLEARAELSDSVRTAIAKLEEQFIATESSKAQHRQEHAASSATDTSPQRLRSPRHQSSASHSLTPVKTRAKGKHRAKKRTHAVEYEEGDSDEAERSLKKQKVRCLFLLL